MSFGICPPRVSPRAGRRTGNWISVAALLVSSMALSAWFPPGARAELSGPVEVLDGDTLELSGRQIRLFGIDAPDRRQTCERRSRAWPCGARATETLARLVGGRDVICYERDRDAFGRVQAVCYAAGRELNSAMVRAGMALAYRNRPTDYGTVEIQAKQAGRGLWSGAFTLPWDWSMPDPAD